MLAHVVAVVFLWSMFSFPRCVFCESESLLRFMQVEIAGGKSCQKMYIRCIKELSGFMETFFRQLLMERESHGEIIANTCSQVQAGRLRSDLKRYGGPPSRKRENAAENRGCRGGGDGQVKEPGHADVASSMQIKQTSMV